MRELQIKAKPVIYFKFDRRWDMLDLPLIFRENRVFN